MSTRRLHTRGSRADLKDFVVEITEGKRVIESFYIGSGSVLYRRNGVTIDSSLFLNHRHACAIIAQWISEHETL